MMNLTNVAKRLLVGSILLGLAACSSTADQSMTVLVDDVFTVGMGQTAVITSEDLSITFDNVLDDSRCPTNVDCFWSGEARGTLTVQQGDGEPVALEFNTNPAPDLNQQSFTFNGYTLELQSLDPYPQDADKAIDADDYRVTLVVTKQ